MPNRNRKSSSLPGVLSRLVPVPRMYGRHPIEREGHWKDACRHQKKPSFNFEPLAMHTQNNGNVLLARSIALVMSACPPPGRKKNHPTHPTESDGYPVPILYQPERQLLIHSSQHPKVNGLASDLPDQICPQSNLIIDDQVTTRFGSTQR